MKTINLTWKPANQNCGHRLPNDLIPREIYNVHIFVPNIPANYASMPTVWTWLKTYYEDNGKYPTKFNWIKPQYFQNHDVDKIWAHLENQPPDVFGFGGYIWNIDLCYTIAQRVKQRWPNCLVIAGGPQPEYKSSADYFAQHPFIDVVVPFDGEVPFTEILDLVAEQRRNFDEISDIVLPSVTDQGFVTSKKHTDRKEFRWQRDVFTTQIDMLMGWIQEARERTKILAAMVETTRGCPYRCTFCDWGGGTYTKVRVKPLELVLKELDWIAEHKIHTLRLLDANFGIMKRDPEIAAYIADLKLKTGWPKDVVWYPAKQNKDRVVQIYKEFHRAGLVYDYNISMQSISEDLKANIRRTDFDWNESIEIAREMKKIGLESTVRILLGVPGMTWDNFLTDIDEILDKGINYPEYDPWMMLPNSPGADPDYIKEFDIKLIERAYEVNIGVALKPHVPYDDKLFGGISLGFRQDNSTAWYVVGTNSYTIDDWIGIYCMNRMMIGLSRTGLTKFIAQYLHDVHKVSHSSFYLDLYRTFLRDPILCGQSMYRILDDHIKTITSWVYDDHENLCRGTEISVDILPNFPFVLTPENYWTFLGLAFSADFYERLSPYLLDIYHDNRISEVIRYNKIRLLSPDYDPDIGRQAMFDWDWYDYFENGQPLRQNKNRITINDSHVGVGTLNHEFTRPIRWHLESDYDEKLLQFFYHTSVNVRSSRLMHVVHRQTGEIGPN